MGSVQQQIKRTRLFTALVMLVLLLCAVVIVLSQLDILQQPVLYFKYVQIHAFMDLFAIVVAAMAFAVGWHQHKRSLKTVILTSAFFAGAWLDAGHMLSFPDMPYFITPNAISDSIRFWLAARLVTALALLAFALYSMFARGSKGNRYLGLGLAIALVFAVYWVVVKNLGALPSTFQPDLGYTTFTLWAEYLIIGVYLLAALILMPVAWYRGLPARLVYIVVAILILALAEVIVVQNNHRNDLFDLIAHAYKAVAYLFVYWAIFVEAVQEPYDLLKESEQTLALSENKFRGLLEFAPDAVLVLNESDEIITMNQMAETMFGVSRADAVGTDGLGLVPVWEENLESPEIMCQRMSGAWFPAEVNRGQLQTPGGINTMVVVRDISERKRLHQTFVDQLTHDALTGLPNRTLIIGRLQHSLVDAKMTGYSVAVHSLNIDFFKKVNDTFGYSCGDDVLRQCVERLTGLLAPGDTLARYGGDEFIIVQNRMDSLDQAAMFAAQLLSAMRIPFCIRDQKVFLSASIGIAVYPQDETTEEGLLHKANVAMSSVKRDGKDANRFYVASMDEYLRDRFVLEGHLHNAVQAGELLLHYQPKVHSSTGDLMGVEALVRWQHPTLGLVPPGDFIPIAEDSGLIAEIGLWVLQEACRQACVWHAQGLPLLRISVNLSARQFHQADLPAKIRQVLDESGLDPTLLELEITESAVMRDTESAISALNSLKELGVCLSIDDFGTGYSSLSYLKQFPIDVLKIDRSFVKDVMTDPDDAAIAKAIVGLAHGLGLEVIAEGVETQAQAQFMQAIGCDYMQGYYFNPPLEPEAFAQRYFLH